ncbi:hypothetical protein DSCA_40810 [Desulfosarcina alkanivorans]|jgi:predicted Fe-Mo cluster-binding NifX family protein|uniref:Dinitrogenase iron-molybdenum cofactor biosynthesis domain-containing protein n=1 Tax=Desulfosarcina alkanivorans TaxID=571177 RepID=A0A5K7YT18_9BACT|nr:NifB/NifX family molybdenum-iron cluster-binding protein [Desulfosarcina alkanivorans]BBO70151.1 hypothetical protein DSCA_40810 [Desulfosarcina alkanivorans]
MKIAIPASAPDLGARVENRLGTASYLPVIDMEDLSVEALAGPSAAAGPGAGIEAVSTVTDRGARVILAGFVSPRVALALEKHGIAVITPVDGRVMDVIETYRRGALPGMTEASRHKDVQMAALHGPRLLPAFRKAARQFFILIPVLIGVLLLVGLFRGFVSRNLLLTIFSGNVFRDTLWGACIWSMLSGNPVNSYVVAETLLRMGLSLFGATSLMLTWVNVGLLKLPAEMSALGARFAITRTIAAFLMAIGVSILTVILAGGQVQ